MVGKGRPWKGTNVVAGVRSQRAKHWGRLERGRSDLVVVKRGSGDFFVKWRGVGGRK